MNDLFQYSLDKWADGTLTLNLGRKVIARIKECDIQAMEEMVGKLNGKKPKNLKVKEFISEWLKAWQLYRGGGYVVTPQDGARLKQWLNKESDVKQLVSVAVKAWKCESFETKFSLSIAGFVNHFNEIKSCVDNQGRSFMPTRYAGKGAL